MIRLLNALNKHFKLRLAVIFLSGALAVFAFAPYYLLPLFIISLNVLLLFLFHSKSYKESFYIGWAFGFGFFLAGLYWIAYPLMFYFLESYWWLIPFALTFIPCILAIYHGACAMLLHRLNNKNPIIFALYFLCIWTLFELLRNTLFTGFPWLITGYSLAKWPSFIQSASLFGLFGLSFIVLSLTIIPFIFMNSSRNRTQLLLCSLLALPFILNAVYGYYRLNSNHTQLSKYKVKILQTNIDSLLTRNTMDTHAESIIELAKQSEPHDNTLTYVLLPEGILNYFTKDKLIKLINTSVPDSGYLIGGGDRVRYSNEPMAWNSVFVIDHNKKVIALYDKAHLVPFGEYVPLRDLLPNTMKAIVTYYLNGLIDFSKGIGPRTINTGKDLSFSPSICYESLFARDVLNKQDPPKLLINFTTDMWYKDSSGPYQHFDMTKLRAVEYGIPMIRVANTGISGIVDSFGRTLAHIPLHKRETLTHKIPLPLEHTTFYGHYGDMIILIFLGLTFLVIYLPTRGLPIFSFIYKVKVKSKTNM